MAILADQYLDDDNKLPPITPDQFTTYLSHLQALHTNEDSMINFLHPCASAASKNNDNTMHYGEMNKATDRAKFEEVMDKDIQGLSRSEVYGIKRQIDPPKGAKIIKAIWSF